MDKGPDYLGLHLRERHPSTAKNPIRLRAVGRRLALCRQIQWAEGSHESRIYASVAIGPQRANDQSFGHCVAGMGVGDEAALANITAISECAERYASMVAPRSGTLVRSSYNSLAQPAVPPASVALLSAEQHRRFPQFPPLTDEKRIDWCWAYSLHGSRAVLVPAALAYFSVIRQRPNDYLPELTSTGIGCHTSLLKAIVAGLFEVIERDALMIAWLNRLPLRPIDPSDTVLERFLRGPLASNERTYSLYQLPTDGPFPVVLALAWSRDCFPHAVVGSACRPTLLQAAKKALFEARQILWSLRGKQATRPDRVRTLEDHCDYYAASGGDVLIRQIFGDLEPIRLADEPTSMARPVRSLLNHGVQRLAALGLEVLVVDLTQADVAHLGFHVVRVVMPGAIDMNVDARYARLGGGRLYELPVRLHLRTEPINEADLNALPIPLA